MNSKTGTAKAVEQLTNAIKARVPLIAIETAEESRVIRAIMNIAEEPTYKLSGEVAVESRKVFRWTHTEGIRRMGDLPEGYVSEFSDENGEELNTTEPSFAIQDYIKYALGNGTVADYTERASILVLCDVHRFLMETGGKMDLRTMRALRDLAVLLAPSKSVAVVVGPSLPSLGDADREVYKIDWPLPTQEELTSMVRASARTLPSHIPQDLNGSAEDIGRSLAGLTMTEAKRALQMAIVEHKELTPECAPTIMRIKTKLLEEQQGIKLRESLPADRVGGLEVLKADFAGLPKFMTEEARKLKVKPPRGILLAGPPGTGKSLAASVIGNGTMPVLKWTIGESKSKWVGESEGNTARILAAADAIDNCILLIDEAEKETKKSEGSDVTEAIVAQLLSWMQDKTSNVIVVMTVNHPEDLRGELISRFDWKYFVGYPNKAACTEIVSIHAALRDIEITEGEAEHLGKLAYSRRLSGREIEDLIADAHRRAFFAGNHTASGDIENALLAAVGLAESRTAEIERMVEQSRGKFKLASLEDGTVSKKAAKVHVPEDVIQF